VHVLRCPLKFGENGQRVASLISLRVGDLE
jgi:hypothetical protein